MKELNVAFKIGSQYENHNKARVDLVILYVRLRLSLTSLVAHYCQSLVRFPYNEATRSIATPPVWDASPSQVTPPPPPSISSGFPDSLLVPIYTPGWREAL